MLKIQYMEEIAKKRSHMRNTKLLFHQENVSCHKSVATIAKLQELHFELLPHPPFSPDLASRDFYLFADLKNAPGKETSLERRGDRQNRSLFWDQRWIVLQGDYVDE